MIRYNFINMGFTKTEVSSRVLSTAFSWGAAPGGANFWAEQSHDGLTPVGEAIWKYMIREYDYGMSFVSSAMIIGHLKSLGLDPSSAFPTNLEFEEGHKYILKYGQRWSHDSDGNMVSEDYICNVLRVVKLEDGNYAGISRDLTVERLASLGRWNKFKGSNELPEGFSEDDLVPQKFPFGSFEDVIKLLADSRVYDYDSNVVSTLYTILNETAGFDWQKACGIESYGGLSLLQEVYRVKKGKDNNHFSLFKTQKDLDRGRRTELRVSRALRYMLPKISDATLETVAKAWVDLFIERDYTLHIGKERKDFAHAYGNKLAKSFNPYTTDSRKSLHNSCMRGVIVSGVSPAEVYASGDFHIAWLEDDNGKIAGRVVVYDNKDNGRPQAGPCYGVCESSLNKLENYLKSIDAEVYEESSWKGARVLRIETPHGLVGPYSDLETSLEELDSDYLCFSNYGEVEFSSTSGYASGYGTYCSCCDSVFNQEYEGAYVEGYGEVCQCCLDEDFIWIDSHGEYYHNNDVVEVFYLSSGRPQSSYELRNDCGSTFVWCDVCEEYWDIDYVTYSETMDEYVPNHSVGDYPDYFPNEEEQEEGEAA